MTVKRKTFSQSPGTLRIRNLWICLLVPWIWEEEGRGRHATCYHHSCQVKVFVSYRHSDTFAVAHAIGYALRWKGHDAFVDTEGIEEGEFIRDTISAAIAQCNIMLALVGPLFDVSLLHRPTDAVAFEWHKSKFHNIPILPVLVFDAAVPSRASLPQSIQFVLDRLGFALRQPTFSSDMLKLVERV